MEYVCCLCHKKSKGYGNNPYPADKTPDARCCDECNGRYVIPMRLGYTVIIPK